MPNISNDFKIFQAIQQDLKDFIASPKISKISTDLNGDFLLDFN